MAKEWSVRCPVCESRLVLDDRTRRVMTHQPGRADREGTDERARDLDWDAAVKRVQGRVTGSEDRLEAALHREQRRGSDLDGLYAERLGGGHGDSVGSAGAQRGHGRVTASGEQETAPGEPVARGGPDDWGSPAWMKYLQDLGAQALIRRAEARAQLPGNPFGVEIARRGGLTVVRSLRSNAVFGLNAANAADFPEAARFLAGCKGEVITQFLPEGSQEAPEEEAVARELAAAGWRLKALDPVWAKDLSGEDRELEPAMTVRPIEPGEERVFARTLGTSFDPSASGEGLEATVERLALELTGENWAAFLGEVDGRPVAASCAFLGERGLDLQLAATDPAFRGRGFQRAMIQARIRVGRAAGLRWAVSEPKRYTHSQRALRSLGFELAFVKALYSPS